MRQHLTRSSIAVLQVCRIRGDSNKRRALFLAAAFCIDCGHPKQTSSVARGESLQIATPCDVRVDGNTVQTAGRDCGNATVGKATASEHGVAISAGGNVVVNR
jgi:hypothetical protein